ncbi:MAG: metal-sensitive transcriptional regulator [Thermodesulfobacteriota bacterium]
MKIKEFISKGRKEDSARRLTSIEGQIRGIKRMVQDGRPCVEILTQIAAAQEALKGVGKIIMRNYLENCATNAIRSRKGESIYNELMDVIYKFAK